MMASVHSCSDLEIPGVIFWSWIELDIFTADDNGEQIAVFADRIATENVVIEVRCQVVVMLNVSSPGPASSCTRSIAVKLFDPADSPPVIVKFAAALTRVIVFARGSSAHEERVGTKSTIDRVHAATTIDDVVAVVAVDRVVSCATDERVVADTTVQDCVGREEIVAGVAVQSNGNDAFDSGDGLDRIISVVAVDGQTVVRHHGSVDIDVVSQASHCDRSGSRCADRHIVVEGTTIDGDSVGIRVVRRDSN